MGRIARRKTPWRSAGCRIALARDKRVSEELLVVIGYRCTFVGSYGLNERDICTGQRHAIAKKGLRGTLVTSNVTGA